MGLGRWIKKVVVEGSGLGASLRFQEIIFRRGAGPFASWMGENGRAMVCIDRFLVAADAACGKFGPAWAKRKVGGRCLGAWLLLGVWILLPVGLGMHLIL
jgi:hypothetical protein